MVVPVLGAAHEFGENGEDGNGLDGHLLALEGKPRANIDIVRGCPGRLCRGHSCEGPLWEGRICCVEGVSVSLMNEDVNLREAIEVWFQSATASVATMMMAGER